MKKKIPFIIAGVILVLAVGGYAVNEKVHASQEGLLEVGKKAPDFTLKNYDGTEVSLSKYAGKVVVLEWINQECPFVKRHYKEGNMTMKDLATQYSDQVVWLAINSSHHLKGADNKKWAEQHKLPYPILDDSSGEIAKKFGAKVTPHMFIINSEGNIVYQGAIDNSSWGMDKKPVNYVAAALEEILAGKSVSKKQTRAYGCSVKFAKN